MAQSVRKKKKERKTGATGFKQNPANQRAGIDASKIGMSREAQRTATQKEIDTFQRTGRSPAQQERLRATRRANKDPVQLRVDKRNKERGFTALRESQRQDKIEFLKTKAQSNLDPERSERPKLQEELMTSAIQSVNVEDPIEEIIDEPKQIEFGDLEMGIAGDDFKQLPLEDRERILRDVSQKAALSILGGGLGGTALRRNVLKMSIHGKRFLRDPIGYLSRTGMRLSGGKLVRTTTIQLNGKVNVKWNSKTMNILQQGLNALGQNKGVAFLTAMGFIGATYGIIAQGTFMSGQVSDDTVDTIGGLQFAQASAMRDGDMERAKAITEFGKQIVEEVELADEFLDNVNIWKAGTRNMRTQLFVFLQNEKAIDKALNETKLTETKDFDKLKSELRRLENR